MCLNLYVFYIGDCSASSDYQMSCHPIVYSILKAIKNWTKLLSTISVHLNVTMSVQCHLNITVSVHLNVLVCLFCLIPDSAQNLTTLSGAILFFC